MSRFHPGAPQLRVPPPGRQWRTRRRQDNTFVMARARGVVRRELEWAPVERAREREREHETEDFCSERPRTQRTQRTSVPRLARNDHLFFG